MNHEAGLCRNKDSSALLFEFYCCAGRLGAQVFTQPGSGPVLPTRSKGRQLSEVEQTKPDESGPLATDLPLSGV